MSDHIDNADMSYEDSMALAAQNFVPDPDVYQVVEDLTRKNKTLSDELLRVRTTEHAAAHELDNIAIELGLGHSPKAGVVAEYVRKLLAAFNLVKADREMLRRLLPHHNIEMEQSTDRAIQAVSAVKGVE